jgi:hypothetical protein
MSKTVHIDGVSKNISEPYQRTVTDATFIPRINSEDQSDHRSPMQGTMITKQPNKTIVHESDKIKVLDDEIDEREEAFDGTINAKNDSSPKNHKIVEENE